MRNNQTRDSKQNSIDANGLVRFNSRIRIQQRDYQMSNSNERPTLIVYPMNQKNINPDSNMFN